MTRFAFSFTTIAAISAFAIGALASLAPMDRAMAQQGEDARQPIALDAAERAFVLAEMRAFLQSVEGIVSAVANDRVPEAEAAARKSGMGVMHSVPPTLRQKLPKEFMMMGHATHQAFDMLAEDAKTIADKATALKQLEQILNTCNTCHASYRLSGG